MEDNVLSISEFLNSIDKIVINEKNVFDVSIKAIKTIKDTEQTRIFRYKNIIKNIYYSIFFIKYRYPKESLDIDLLINFIKGVIYLKTDIDFYYDYEDIIINGNIFDISRNSIDVKEICKEAFDEIIKECNFISDVKEIEKDKDFYPEYLLDMGYHINNFKSYAKDDNNFLELLNSKILERI